MVHLVRRTRLVQVHAIDSSIAASREECNPEPEWELEGFLQVKRVKRMYLQKHLE